MLTVRLFGPGQAQCGAQLLAGFPKQQCFQLFCYLLLNRHHPHSRERLAAVFWGDHTTATSRTYLRNTVWRLRLALEAAAVPLDQVLLVSDESICLLRSDAYWLDVESFEVAVESCRDLPGDRLTPSQAADLARAAELYAGDLLEGVYDDWCLYDRERLRLMHLQALSKLIYFHENNGGYEAGLRYAQRMLAQDPTRERVHRHLMRLYWRLGEHHEALAQYKRCAQILREELGVTPAPETRLLYRLMLHDKFDPGGHPASPTEEDGPLQGHDTVILSAAEQVAQRLEQVQAMTEETSAELGHLHRLLRQALGSGSSG